MHVASIDTKSSKLEDFKMKSLKITAVLLVVGLFAAGTSAVMIDPANIMAVASSEWWEGPCR